MKDGANITTYARAPPKKVEVEPARSSSPLNAPDFVAQEDVVEVELYDRLVSLARSSHQLVVPLDVSILNDPS